MQFCGCEKKTPHNVNRFQHSFVVPWGMVSRWSTRSRGSWTRTHCGSPPRVRIPNGPLILTNKLVDALWIRVFPSRREEAGRQARGSNGFSKRPHAHSRIAIAIAISPNATTGPPLASLYVCINVYILHLEPPGCNARTKSLPGFRHAITTTIQRSIAQRGVQVFTVPIAFPYERKRA